MHRGTQHTSPTILGPARPELRPPRGGARPATGRWGAPVGELVRELVGGLLGLTVAAVALVLLGTVARGGPAASARPDDVLLALLAWLGVALAAWLAVGSLLVVLSLLPGTAGRVARDVGARVTPVAVRRCLTLVLGASVGSVALPAAPLSTAGSGPVARDTAAALDAMPVAPHGAASSSPSGSSATPVDPVASPAFVPSLPAQSPGHATASGLGDPGFAPSQPDPPAAASPRANGRPGGSVPVPGYVPSAPAPVLDAQRSRLLAPSPRSAWATHDLVTVRRGDSLWALAARHLGAGASDVEVAREWPRWYAANRSVIGDDPDLLVPGQQLRPPEHPATPFDATAGRTDGPTGRGAAR